MKAIIGALVCATLVLHALSLTIRVDIDVPQDLKTSTGDQTLPYNPAVESVFESSADTKLVTSMAQLTLLDGPGEDQHPITSSEVIGLKDQVCSMVLCARGLTYYILTVLDGEKYSREAIRKAVEKGLDAHYSGDHCTSKKLEVPSRQSCVCTNLVPARRREGQGYLLSTYLQELQFVSLRGMRQRCCKDLRIPNYTRHAVR